MYNIWPCFAAVVPAAALPLDSPERYQGTNRTQLASFCAPLAWCKPQGVAMCSMDDEQVATLSF